MSFIEGGEVVHHYYKLAEQLVEEVLEDLKKFLPHDGEDISCYNPSAVSTSINNLINVKVLLGCANDALGRNTQ